MKGIHEQKVLLAVLACIFAFNICISILLKYINKHISVKSWFSESRWKSGLIVVNEDCNLSDY